MSILDSIVITGGGGMLAGAFRQRLKGRGLSAHLLGRADCDITDEAALAALFKRLSPTLVINCAAYTKVDLAEKEPDRADAVNGTAVGHLARLCEERGAALVHFSTDYVFDGAATAPIPPEAPPRPVSAYGRSKLLGERLLQEHAPRYWLILRTAWLYGPGGPCFPATMINAARAGKPLKVVADQTGAPTFTFDLADAALDLLDRGAAAGVYHVTNAGQTTWFEFTRAILEEFELKTDLSPTTSVDWAKLKPNAAIRPAYSVLDVAATERAIGRPLPLWRDALHRYRLQITDTASPTT